MSAPLSKIRVLDLSRVLAGPWATQLLGDYGADVVKVERPGVGDDTRHWGPPWLDDTEGQAAYFQSTNRNKRSICLDLSLPAAQQIVRELADKADVLIENFKVGAMASFGLGAGDLLKRNPGLIVCSVSAYGQSGSRSGEPGYDAMIQASAGLMSITGPSDDEGGRPQKVGVAISDLMAGMYATTAILAALHARNESGRGQYIDVPLYDSQVAALANQAMNYLIGGSVPRRMGTAHPNLVPYQSFQTADGDLMLTVGNDRQFAHCCRVLGLPKLADDVRYQTMAARIAHRDTLIPLLQEKLFDKSRREWLAEFRASGVPAGPVNSIDEVLGNEHAVERELVRTLRNSDGVVVPTVSNPVHFGETQVEYRLAPPLLGEHTDEVLRDWLGYSDDQIQSVKLE